MRVLQAISLVVLGWAMVLQAQTGPVTWKKVTLSDKYLCDGIYWGDFTKDGKLDIVAGPYIYIGPEFTTKIEFYPVGTFWNTSGVPQGEPSNSLFSFPWDINADGWLDVVVLGRAHLHEPHWYENPKKDAPSAGAAGHWKKYKVFDRVWGENPQMVLFDGDTKPDILCNWDGKVGWLTPGDDVTKPWTFKGMSREGTWFNFTHGIGAGDLNGDGRQDMIQPDFWWEQPATWNGTAQWTERVTEFREDKGNGQGGAQMFAYDVDGDGDQDVITSLAAHLWGLAWYENQEKGTKWVKHKLMGTRSEESTYGVAFSQPHAMEMHDVDGDGLKDIILGKRRWAHGPNGDVEPSADPVIYWWKLSRAGGTATFKPYQIDKASGVGLQMSVRDVNGDGTTDIMTVSKLGAFVFLNQTPPLGVKPDPKLGKTLYGAQAKLRDYLEFRNGWDVAGRSLSRLSPLSRPSQVEIYLLK